MAASWKLLLTFSYIMCHSLILCQRMDKFTCERRPTHTSALKTPGDNGFSIKIIGTPPPEYYIPGKDYQVFVNGSYMNQQFLDFMLVAVPKSATSERQTAGTFIHTLSHMTKADAFCNHVMTSVTFHPSFKKSSAQFTWTAPPAGTGCVLFKGTVLEHPDIWYSDDGGLIKMFCEKEDLETETESVTPSGSASPTGNTPPSTTRPSNKCCACDVAKYEMTFVGNWSRDSHPKDFPPKQFESLLHWSDIIGASHSPRYTVWGLDQLATNGVKEVCEYGWPRTLEGEIKQQGRNVRTVIRANGIWGYPDIYTTKRTARFSADNDRPFVSLLTMVGPSPDWCIGVDSLNLCLNNCTWVDKMDLDLYPWDAGTDSGVAYLSGNLPTYPREKIRPITNSSPDNPASPFYGGEKVKPMGTVRIRRIGQRSAQDSDRRCEPEGALGDNSNLPASSDETEEAAVDPKCMTTEWSDFSDCSVTCGVGIKSRSRQFKTSMGTVKNCPDTKLQEVDNCLGLVNQCDSHEQADLCVTSPWSGWSPCSVTCGSGTKARTRQYLNPMGENKCTQILTDQVTCNSDIPDCLKATMMVDWESVCSLSADSGPCVGSFPRFYYNSSVGECQAFSYGGCRGNQNRFDSLDECSRICEAVMSNIDSDDLSLQEAGDNDDCMVTEWTSFSDCSVSCGAGIQSRSRMIKRRNTGNGQQCPKDLYHTRVCASFCAASEDMDCMLSEWSHWGECSTTCERGSQVRQRMVKRPARGRGEPCEGELKEMRECNLGHCLIEDYSQCMLSEWSDWSECSELCGEGEMVRQRMEKRGPCPPDTLFTISKRCTGVQCSATESRDCVISEWTTWTPCDRPCDMGSQTRFRMVVQPETGTGRCSLAEPKEMVMRTCYLQSCDKMSLAITTPSTEVLDCQVSEWGEWTACSKTCGTGRQIRRREVTQRRRNGGARCPPLKDRRRCSTGVRCSGRRHRRVKH